MKRKLFILICVFAFTFLYPLRGETMAVRLKNIEKIKEEFKKIDKSDGVASDEAVIIAKYYVVTNENYENLELDKYKIMKSDFNENWIVISFDASTKYKRESGLKWFSIHIDKDTGDLKVRGWGPS